MTYSYLVGLLFGDGTSNISKNGAYAVWIDQHKRNLKIIERAREELENLGLNVHYYSHSNKMRAMVYNKKLYNEFKHIRKNPVEFFAELSKEDKNDFIAGFFDAEGTVTDRLVVYNSHKKLLESIREYLTGLKICGQIYRYGKVFGIQIYKKKCIEEFEKQIKSVKISSSLSLVNKRRGLLVRKDLYSS